MHPVLKTVLGRLGLGLATLFIVSIIIFSAIEMLPGDFGQAILGQAATEETVAAFRRELGLDEPPYIRYLQWVGGAIQGDLGTSFSGRNASGTDRSREVIDLIAPRLWNTLFLMHFGLKKRFLSLPVWRLPPTANTLCREVHPIPILV